MYRTLLLLLGLSTIVGCLAESPGDVDKHVQADLLPGLTVVATAAATAAAGADLPYTFQVHNGGATAADSVVVDDLLPAGTTFVALSGATCVAPAVGSTGSLSCMLGTLAPGASTSFVLTVHVSPAAPWVIYHGDYQIQATGVAPFLGPLAVTTIQQVYVIQATVAGGNGAIGCESPVLTGASSRCTITPAAGFALSALTVDGKEDLAGVTGGTYTLALVTAAHDVAVAFAPADYRITASVPGGNGTVSCSDPVSHGASATCTMTPAAGYVLAGLLLDGSDVSSEVVANTYTIANVTAAHLVQGRFASAPYNILASVPGGNGSLTCTSPVSLGQESSCQPSPAAGYWLTALTVDGLDVFGQLSGNRLAIPYVTADHAVQASFAVSPYQLTVKVPAGNGTITCSLPLSQGGSGSCLIAPAVGYLLSALTLDGINVLTTVAGNTLTVPGALIPHVVAGTFVQNTNLIAVSVPGGNGTVVCSSPVLSGQSSICQIAPAPGYRLHDLLLDGTSIYSQVLGNSFVLALVTTPHTLQGSFTPVPQYAIAVSVVGGNGTISCDTPIAEGRNANCTLIPAAGYTLDTLTLDGRDGRVLVQGSLLTLYQVSAPHTLTGAFRRLDATRCATAADCHSGFCSDGVCCDRACQGQCEACDVSGQVGTCRAFSGVPHAGHPSCGEFLCSEVGCWTECVSTAECVPGAVCTAGACRPGIAELAGPGLSGCSATGHRSSSGAGAAACLALLMLGTRRSRYRAA